MGKIATKLDAQTLRQDVLPTTLALCQDIDWEVRHLMCRHLGKISNKKLIVSIFGQNVHFKPKRGFFSISIFLNHEKK